MGSAFLFDFGALRKHNQFPFQRFSVIGLIFPFFSINEDFDSRKGTIYENLLATMINDVGFPLHYYGNGTEHLEIDFLLETKDGTVLPPLALPR